MALKTTLRGCCGAFYVLAIACDTLVAQPRSFRATGQGIEYRVLATSKTSTMEKELNEAAEAGFRFRSAMGGETAFGGREAVVVMARTPEMKERFA